MYNIIYTYSILYCYLNQVILYTHTLLFFSHGYRFRLQFNYSVMSMSLQLYTCTYMFIYLCTSRKAWIVDMRNIHIVCLCISYILLSLFIELTMTMVYTIYRLDNQKFHNKIIRHAQWNIIKCLSKFKIVRKKTKRV